MRDIAARAGVGMGTLYRHFPTRADLVVAVYRHQVEACAEAAPRLIDEAPSPHQALEQWVNLFVDFLVTKHGLADVVSGDTAGADALHRYFVERLVPAGDLLLEAVFGPAATPINGYTLLRGIGNLCIGTDSLYDTRQAVRMFVRGVLGTRD